MTVSAAQSRPDGGSVFCTLFDCGYLTKGMVMLESLHRVAPHAVVQVLCLDDRVHALLTQLAIPNARLIRLTDLEDAELLRLKGSRTRAEYCWTLSSALCHYVSNASPESEFVTYLDADLMFFSDPTPLWREMKDASIAITDHRYPPPLQHLAVYGRFNVQWVVFRRDEIGLACLDRWRTQSLEWCHAWLEEGRFGDQKYLDEWPARYGRAVHVVEHPGAGIGPWNIFGSRITCDGDTIHIDGAPLIFYHYHSYHVLSDGGVDYMPSTYRALGPVPMAIYGPYGEALTGARERVRRIDPTYVADIRSAGAITARRWIQRFAPTVVKNFLKRLRRR